MDNKKTILIFALIFIVATISKVYATSSIVIPTTTYFYIDGDWRHFNTVHTFSNVCRVDGVWYFDGKGFFAVEGLAGTSGSSDTTSHLGPSSDTLYAALLPIVIGLAGIVMMILGPALMVWKLKEGIFENMNWMGYSMVLFIIGLGLFIYLLTS